MKMQFKFKYKKNIYCTRGVCVYTAYVSNLICLNLTAKFYRLQYNCILYINNRYHLCVYVYRNNCIVSWFVASLLRDQKCGKRFSVPPKN